MKAPGAWSRPSTMVSAWMSWPPAEPAADIGDHGGHPVPVVDDDEPAQREALADGQAEIAGARGRLGGVVVGDRAAHGDPAVVIEHHQGRVQVIGADVVEVDVDAVRCRLPQLVHDGAVPVVERGVEPDLAEPADLVVAPGAADHPPGALEPGDLAGHAAHRARRAGHEHHLAGLERGDVEQAHVGGQRSHAENAQVDRRGQALLGDHLPRLAGRQHRLVPPAQHVQDQVPRGQAG